MKIQSFGSGDGMAAYLKPAGMNPPRLLRCGTYEDWRDQVAGPIEHSPCGIVSISAALAAPTLRVCELEGGLINFRADSSKGKTTCLFAGASVVAKPDDPEPYVRSMRFTANGAEGMAAAFNDLSMFLDEVSLCAPNDLGDFVYFFSGGKGKTRANVAGQARPVHQWRGLGILSAEVKVEEHITTGGKRARSGQAVRCLDLSV
ncbi:MAG: DUF927 domain-containing protein, partial [Acetobacteraceae bacterium]|nr:DUF927 domain-containing protein [Acetobacteraceae bacterium]